MIEKNVCKSVVYVFCASYVFIISIQITCIFILFSTEMIGIFFPCKFTWMTKHYVGIQWPENTKYTGNQKPYIEGDNTMAKIYSG